MIKQYVNLRNSAADHYGASINLVVNADQLDDESAAYTEWWVEATGATLCTMFFRDDDDVDVDGKFCASCLPRLKRVSLSRAKMNGQGWNDY